MSEIHANGIPASPFPPGKWRVEITNVAAMDFDANDLLTTVIGLFMVHQADPLESESQERVSFVPWHRVIRAYQIG